MNTKAYIVLANGQVFEGKSFGATGCVTGEVVFTTGMTGYLETLTDPSNYGQIILQTFPLAGDYGIIRKDAESSKAHAVGFVVREWCATPSNFRCEGKLNDLLIEKKIPGIYGIDTRKLTKILRNEGTMNGLLTYEAPGANKDALLEKIKAHKATGLVEKITVKDDKVYIGE